MALTFVRTSELIGAGWDEVDFDTQQWRIPADRMKMKTPHIVPLSTQAVDVLKTLHLITGNRKHLGEAKETGFGDVGLLHLDVLYRMCEDSLAAGRTHIQCVRG